jgi:predicted acetyltransferase
MVENRITDGKRIAQLLASELTGLEQPPLDRIEVVDATPDVELDVGALAQLLLGTGTATDLARTEDLGGFGDSDPNQSVLRALDAAYPETDACMLQFF